MKLEFNEDGSTKRVYSQELGFDGEPFEVVDADGYAGMDLYITDAYIKYEQLDKIIELLEKAKTQFYY